MPRRLSESQCLEGTRHEVSQSTQEAGHAFQVLVNSTSWPQTGWASATRTVFCCSLLASTSVSVHSRASWPVTYSMGSHVGTRLQAYSRVLNKARDLRDGPAQHQSNNQLSTRSCTALAVPFPSAPGTPGLGGLPSAGWRSCWQSSATFQLLEIWLQAQTQTRAHAPLVALDDNPACA